MPLFYCSGNLACFYCSVKIFYVFYAKKNTSISYREIMRKFCIAKVPYIFQQKQINTFDFV